ncbi:MAG: hypothetical protein L6R39_001895 [Caloplaca ligustica]|nr:MAG: hypothetical protein L6R39_001895 [Caloplaca ligustica]
MASGADLQPRQIWANPTPTSTSLPRHCTPVRLPSGGLLAIGDGNTITLTQDVVFQPYCTSKPDVTANISNLESITTEDKDPFYASTFPQMYAIAAVTVVSYLLVIILFITPRTFFVGGSGGGSGFLGHRGMISGASGSASVIGVGGRPWLQKVAALTVAVSLTIASVDTFKAAERQYAGNYSDATALTNEVVSSLELRIVRVISETFLWLAQAQTLIRLFPRHKEKVIIKWAGFVLIGLDTIFSILNSFVSGTSRSTPRRFQDAVPALRYLFTFCLSLIYAAWIIYYSLSKRRYAFIHPKMGNICLVALLSYVAVLIPVVFFILDISIYDVAGWGNYVRWVGAAAASVVVWEWVERIEALERDERKDGILGREIFDGDEMLEITPSSAVAWASSRRPGGNSGNNHTSPSPNVRGGPSIIQRINRKRQRLKPRPNQTSRPSNPRLANEFLMTGGERDVSVQLPQPTPSTTAATPSSRLGSIKPESPVSQEDSHTITQSSSSRQSSPNTGSGGKPSEATPPDVQPGGHGLKSLVTKTLWDTLQRIPIPFLSRHMSPPIEVKQAVRSGQQLGTAMPPQTSTIPPGPDTYSLFGKFGVKKKAPAPQAPLPVTIVPAPPRNPTSWNNVRFDARSPPSSRPFSHQDFRDRTVCSGTPVDPSARQMTPTVDTEPSAPAQAYRSLRGSALQLSQVVQASPSNNRANIPMGGNRPLSRISVTANPGPRTEEQQASGDPDTAPHTQDPTHVAR